MVRAIDAYTIHPEEGVNLMNNSSLFGPNPAAARTLRGLDPADLVDYPPIDSRGLREAAARHLDVDADMVVTGNGTNELIDVILRTAVDPGDPVAYHPPSFSMIPHFVRTNGGTPAPIPLGDGWRLDPAGFADADPKVALVCRPNNPTGNAFPRVDVLQVVEDVDGVVVVDEAYVEFGPGSLADALDDHPNLVLLRTFSKAHGLAGFRVGYAVAHPDLAREIGKVRAPFRLDAVAERAAVASLEDPTYVEDAVRVVRRERERLRDRLDELGVPSSPTDANFVLLEPPCDAVELAAALRRRGFLVRDFGGDLAPYLRATVGPPDVMDGFVRALEDALQEVVPSA